MGGDAVGDVVGEGRGHVGEEGEAEGDADVESDAAVSRLSYGIAILLLLLALIVVVAAGNEAVEGEGDQDGVDDGDAVVVGVGEDVGDHHEVIDEGREVRDAGCAMLGLVRGEQENEDAIVDAFVLRSNRILSFVRRGE